jgi:hypothetical protein
MLARIKFAAPLSSEITARIDYPLTAFVEPELDSGKTGPWS